LARGTGRAGADRRLIADQTGAGQLTGNGGRRGRIAAGTVGKSRQPACAGRTVRQQVVLLKAEVAGQRQTERAIVVELGAVVSVQLVTARSCDLRSRIGKQVQHRDGVWDVAASLDAGCFLELTCEDRVRRKRTVLRGPQDPTRV